MGYAGETYIIPCGPGGINGSLNKASLQPYDMIPANTRNLNIHKGGRQRRGGTAKVTAEIDSGVRLVGMFDYLKPAGSQFIVFGTLNGKIWKNATTTIKTGWQTDKFIHFSEFGGELYACNAYNTPGKWDGITWTDLTDIPSDWAGTNFPGYMITHGRGASVRNWAFACPSTPYTVYVSPSGDGDDFSDANVTTLNIDTRDGFGIEGAVVHADRLVMLGRNKPFIIDDSDTDTTNWGYMEANWDGGVAHQRLITQTPNDIVCMTEQGEIYSVIAAETYGDFEQASLTRPSFIHSWIKDNLLLSYINDFHSVYDPVLRAVKIFVVRSGQTTADTALVYFIDRGPKDGWMIHDNQSYVSGYSASCSCPVRVGTGNYQVYTGGYSGFIWKLEQSAKTDDSNAFTSSFRTPPLHLDNPRANKDFKRGWVNVNVQGTETINAKVYIDGSQIETPEGAWSGSTTYTTGQIVTYAGKIYESLVDSNLNKNPASQTAYWKQHHYSMTVVSGTSDYDFEIGNKGGKIEVEIYNDIASEDFFINDLKIDFKYLGAKPANPI